MITVLALMWLALCIALSVRLVRTNVLEAKLLDDPKARETKRLLANSANPFTAAAWTVLMFIFPPVGAAILFDQTVGGGSKVRTLNQPAEPKEAGAKKSSPMSNQPGAQG